MALNTCKMWFNGIKIAFFSKKLQKIAQRLGSSPTDLQSLRQLGTPPPDPRLWYLWIELHKLSQHVSKVRYLHFSTISLSPLSFQNPGWVPLGNDFRSSTLRYLCSTKTSFENFWWRYCMWFVVWPPPSIKNFGHAYGLEIAWQTFWRPFFWRTLAVVSLVLGLEHSCPWPREGLSSKKLSLASDFFVSLALASSLVFSTPLLWSSGKSMCYWSGRLGFDSRSDQTKDYKNWYSQVSCLPFSN